MSVTPRDQRRVLAVMGVVFLTALVYAPVATFGFVNQDDPTYILVNPYVQQGLTFESLRWSFSTLYFSNWHPLTWISYLLDVQMFGVDAGAMHLVNLMIHLANTALLAWVLLRMTRDFGPSLFVAAAFALHPLHVESVAWISERKDVLSTLFWLLAMLAYTEYARHDIADASKANRRRFAYGMTLLAFAAGLMAKPMVITLPFVLLLCDYWPLRRERPWRRLVVEKAPFFALCALSAVLTVVAQHRGGAIGRIAELGFGYRVANAIAAYGAYLWKTVWPAALSPFYPHPGAGIAWWNVAAALTGLVAISWIAWRIRNGKPYVWMGWLWFLGTLVPVIGIVQVGSQAMADRYTYVPLIGVFVAAAWLARDVLGGRRAAPFLATGVMVAMAVLTSQQVWIWRDSVSLFSHALAVSRPSSAIHTNLGVALAESGRYEEAIPHLETALALQPDVARTYYNLGLVYEALDETLKAVTHYERCLAIDPEYADAWNNLGMLRMRGGTRQKAKEDFERALAARPDHLLAHVNLGDVYAAGADWDAAAECYSRALRISAAFPLALCRLAVARKAQNRPDEARELARRALRINPEYAEARRVLEGLE